MPDNKETKETKQAEVTYTDTVTRKRTLTVPIDADAEYVEALFWEEHLGDECAMDVLLVGSIGIDAVEFPET